MKSDLIDTLSILPYLKQQKKELSTKTHEGPRRHTKKDNVHDPLKGNAPWVRVRENAASQLPPATASRPVHPVYPCSIGRSPDQRDRVIVADKPRRKTERDPFVIRAYSCSFVVRLHCNDQPLLLLWSARQPGVWLPTFHPSYFKLHPSHFKLHPSHFKLHTSNFKLPTTTSRIPCRGASRPVHRKHCLAACPTNISRPLTTRAPFRASRRSRVSRGL